MKLALLRYQVKALIEHQMLNRQERVKQRQSASITILPRIGQLDQLLVIPTKMAALRKGIGLVQGVKAYVNLHPSGKP